MFATDAGGIDRILRSAGGLAPLARILLGQGQGFRHWANLIGVVPLLTGLRQTCPLCKVAGVSTCPVGCA